MRGMTLKGNNKPRATLRNRIQASMLNIFAFNFENMNILYILFLPAFSKPNSSLKDVFVDGTTKLPPKDQNGTRENPFRTLKQALAVRPSKIQILSSHLKEDEKLSDYVVNWHI